MVDRRGALNVARSGAAVHARTRIVLLGIKGRPQVGTRTSRISCGRKPHALSGRLRHGCEPAAYYRCRRAAGINKGHPD